MHVPRTLGYADGTGTQLIFRLEKELAGRGAPPATIDVGCPKSAGARRKCGLACDTNPDHRPVGRKLATPAPSDLSKKLIGCTCGIRRQKSQGCIPPQVTDSYARWFTADTWPARLFAFWFCSRQDLPQPKRRSTRTRK